MRFTQEKSQYQVECVCGRLVVTTEKETVCKGCLRKLVIEWRPTETPAKVIEFRRVA